MIQTLSFPRKRAISELSTSLQLPTQTLYPVQMVHSRCPSAATGFVFGYTAQMLLKNIDDGSQTYSEVSVIDRMTETLGTGTNQTAHVLRGVSQEFGQCFSPAFLTGPCYCG